jgi:RNA polymerase sigma factor (sigma-70 family)
MVELTNKDEVEKLVKACIKGDRKSQNILYKTFYSKMLGICMRYANNHSEAQDLFHDGFIKVFSKLKSFENKGSLEGWIRRIIVNNAVDYVRTKSFHIEYDDDSKLGGLQEEEVKDFDFDPEKDLKLKAELLLELIQELAPAYRTVFNLFVIDQYSHKEIAEKLNITVGTSKSNLSKAKLKLRELFNKNINKIGK